MKSAKGFTLIEVMVVVIIVAIIVSFALPGYRAYVLAGKRVEGQALISSAAARQERYRAQNGSYAATVTALYGESSITSETRLYNLGVAVNPGDGGYTLTATQNHGDTECGNFTLTATGVKGVSGSKTVEECWK